jgi:hypothetical protein
MSLPQNLVAKQVNRQISGELGKTLEATFWNLDAFSFSYKTTPPDDDKGSVFNKNEILKIQAEVGKCINSSIFQSFWEYGANSKGVDLKKFNELYLRQFDGYVDAQLPYRWWGDFVFDSLVQYEANLKKNLADHGKNSPIKVSKTLNKK